MSLGKRERETTIRFDATKDEVWIYTGNPSVKRKIERKGFLPWKTDRYAGKERGWFYHMPYRMLRWGFATISRGVRPGFGARKPSP